MLPGNTPALFGGAPAGVGNDSFTKLLLHMNGANGSTTINDSSLSAKGNGTVGTTASISTAQSVFGGASLSLAGGNTSYVTFPSHADYNFSNGDFTIDCRARWNNLTNQNGVAVRDNLSNTPWIFGYNTSAGALSFWGASVAGTFDIANNQTMGTVVANQWYHLAVTRQGSNFKTFLDGVQKAAWTHAGTFYAGASVLIIGGRTSAFMNGYIDELRISKGIARWTAAFTPPASAYA